MHNINTIKKTGTTIELKKQAYSRIDYDFSGQARPFAKCVIDEIFEYCENNLSNYVLTECKLEEAINIILSLETVLSWGKDKKSRVFYTCFNWGGNEVLPWHNDVFFMHMSNLKSIISQYLSHNWFSSPTFEWYIINPYLRYFINLCREEIYHNDCSDRSSASSLRSFFYYYANLIMDKAPVFIIYSSIRYVMPPYLIAYTFDSGWPLTAFLILLGYIYSSLLGMIGFFKNKKIRDENIDTLVHLSKIKTYASSKSWSPTKLMQKINALDGKANIQELTPLISKMIKRDRDVFNARF